MSKLTPAERAILINQYEILQNSSGTPNRFQNHIEVLTNGYESEYENYIEGLREPLPEDRCDYVRDIMWLYYLLKAFKNADHIKNGTGPRDADGRLKLEELDPKFPGFDGNNEPELLAYANFIVKKAQEHQEHNHYLNSHGSQPDYDSMLDAWQELGKPTELTSEHVETIMEAGRA